MDAVPFELWALGQLFVSMWQRLRQRHPAGTWPIHPKSCWNEVQNTYCMIQTNSNWRNMKSITPIYEWHPPKHTFMILSLWSYLCWWLFVTLKHQRSEGHPKHDLPIHHLPHLWLRWIFFGKIRNIFLHYLVALGSCNTRFEEEKWELSQLEYSGGIQLLQKDFDMEKTYVDADWANKTYQSSKLIQNVPFLRILNHKTYLSYI